MKRASAVRSAPFLFFVVPMKTPAILAILVSVVTLGTSVLKGAVNNELWGSTDLRGLSEAVLASCPAAAALQFVPTSANGAEQRLFSASQELAPMTRLLDPKLVCQASDPREAQGAMLAVEALGVFANASSVQCSTASLAHQGQLNFPTPCPELGCFGSSYSFSGFTGLFGEGWKDVLRLLFTGIHHNGVRDCGSPVRRALIANHEQLFNPGCAVPGRCPAGLSHVYRPGDATSAARGFLALLSLPEIEQAPFCNGTTYDDRDKVRVPCVPSDRTCSNYESQDKTSGVVVSLAVPSNHADSVRYPTLPCTPGVFRRAQSYLLTTGYCKDNPSQSCFLSSECGVGGICKKELCPERDVTVGGTCRVPIRLDASQPTGYRFDCVNTQSNITPTQSVREDGRVFNTYLYNARGILQTDQNGKKIVGARYRVRQDSCQLPDSDDQIRCTAAEDICSLGLTRRPRTFAPSGAQLLASRGIEATQENIQKITTAPADTYPLSIPLFVNTLVGFDRVSAPEEAGATACFLDAATLRTKAPPQGLFSLKDGIPACIDFDETRCNLLGCSTNAECASLNLGQCLGGFCAAPCTTSADCTGGRSCLSQGRCGYSTNSASCNGSVSFEGRITLCPEFTFVFASPLQTGVGGQINVSATASDADNDPLSFSWTATAGSFVNPAAASTKYNCTSAGTQVLTVTATDGICEKQRTVNVTCTN